MRRNRRQFSYLCAHNRIRGHKFNNAKYCQMSKYIFSLLISASFFAVSCGDSASTTSNDSANDDSAKVSYQYYGDTITADGAIPASELIATVGSAPSMNLKVEGKIESCCQKKGCWTEVFVNDSETVHVTFKDYGFFVPMDAGGKTIIMEGVAKYDTTNVEMLKHLASDAGKSQAEIDKITESEFELVFEASGVIIRD